MAHLKLTVGYPVSDGTALVFRAPCDCVAVTGLVVYFPSTAGGTDNTVRRTFTFKDAHNNDLTNLGELFTEGSMVKVVLDLTNGAAFLQNADTNAYLEKRFDEVLPGLTVTQDGDNTRLRKITVVEDTTATCPEFIIDAPFTTNKSPYNDTPGKDTSLIKLVSYTCGSIIGPGNPGGTSRTLVWGRDVNGTMSSALYANKTDSPNSYLGTPSNPWGSVYATTGTIQTSARDAKENIKSVISAATPMTLDLRGEPAAEEISDITTETIVDFVRNLQPVTFNYKTDEEEVTQESVQLGLIADDIAEHDVYKYIGVTGEEGQETYGLQAMPLVTAALTTCKHLLEQIDYLTARIEELETRG